MHKKAHWILGFFVVAIVVAFFLPWVEVQSGAVGAVSKLLTGKRQATLDSISGFRVPIMANGSESRFMIDVIKIFSPGIKDADKKSWLIWIVPLFAVFLWWAFVSWQDRKWFLWAMGAAGVGIFLVGTYYIWTTDLNKVVLNVRISVGLWMTLVGYCAMGLTAIWVALRGK